MADNIKLCKNLCIYLFISKYAVRFIYIKKNQLQKRNKLNNRIWRAGTFQHKVKNIILNLNISKKVLKLRYVKHEEYFLLILTKSAEIWVGNRKDTGRIKKRTNWRNHTDENKLYKIKNAASSIDGISGTSAGSWVRFRFLQRKKLILCFKQNSKTIANTEVCHTRSNMKPLSVDSRWTKYEPCGSKPRLFGRTSNRFTYLFLLMIAEQGWNHSSY